MRVTYLEILLIKNIYLWFLNVKNKNFKKSIKLKRKQKLGKTEIKSREP